jgi:hypothetical protein
VVTPGADQHGIVQQLDPEPRERRGQRLRAVDRVDARELPGASGEIPNSTIRSTSSPAAY